MSTLEAGRAELRRRYPRRWLKYMDPLGRKLLSAQEAKILNTLLCRQGFVVTDRELLDALYADREDGGPITAHGCLKTIICWLRFCGWPIENVWGKGYMIRWERDA